MPMKGYGETSSKVSSQNSLVTITKRLALLAFVALGAMFALDRFGAFDAFGQKASRRIFKPAVESAVNADDCSYVKSPGDYTDVTIRHRNAVSQLTESVAARFQQEGVALVPPQNMPRKNFVDDLIFDKMQSAGVESAPNCTDEEFLRRVTLDLTGRIPSPADVTNFLKDQTPNKRDILIDSLINSSEFVDKWTMFFGDLYKNTANSTNINRFVGGREAFYRFIRDSIESNKSYAQMASEIISSRGDSYVDGATNFIIGGFVPMGPAQDTYDGYAVQTAQTFLGLSSMDCLLCHDGAGHLDAVNLWGSKVTRADAWGMAAFFARVRRQTVTVGTLQKYMLTEAATGEYDLNTNNGNRSSRLPMGSQRNVAPKYMFGNRGGVSNGADRRTVLARYITEDPQFARATVNYLWEKMMVEALVSPSSAFDLARLNPDEQLPEGWSLQPNNAELLEALTQEFINNNYNLRHIIRLIAQSSTYQLSSKYPGTWKIEYVPLYARKFARRLEAEELHDAIVKATNLPPVTNAVTANSVTVSPRMIGFPIIDEANTKLREVQWAMQLPDSREPRFGQQNGSSANILNTFLRGNRDVNLRQADSSILQALNMMNNDFVLRFRTRYIADNNTNNSGNSVEGYIAPIAGYNTEKISSTVKRVMETPGLTNEQIITELYLNTLSRNPKQSEIAKVLPYFTSMGKQGAIESLQWVLLNKVDFLFNY